MMAGSTQYLYSRAVAIGDMIFRHANHGGTMQRYKAVRSGYRGFKAGENPGNPGTACGGEDLDEYASITVRPLPFFEF